MTVLQGVEMGRPSQIDLRVTKSNRAITRVEIAGSSVPVMSGTIEI
jgi:trans-2,3-dihydro-3-hydroxyanthranilate isomerase